MNSNDTFPRRILRHVTILLLAAMAAAMLLPAAASAQGTAKTVRVGWYDSPFNQIDRFNRRSGYAYEYQQKIAAYTGWTYEYVEGSWPELMQMLIDGKIDLLSDVSYTEERAEQMLFSSLPMGAEEYYIFTSPNNREIHLDNPRTLNGKRIAINKGSVQAGYYREWAKQHGVQAELIEMVEGESVYMQMVQDGELDAYITLDAYGGLGTVVPVFKIGSSDFYFAVNRERVDLREELDSAMNRIESENRFYSQHLYQKYISTSGANLFLGYDELTWLAERENTIRIGYQDDYLAFCARDEQTGELTGILMNEDYQNRAELLRQFEHAQEESVAAVDRWGRVSVATGIADYDPQADGSLSDTFRRADRIMYENKRLWKKAQSVSG